MSIDPRAIADETGVDEEDVLAVLDALDEADRDENDLRVLDDGGEHDPDGPFFSAPALDAEGGKPIEVADTDEILGDALANEWDGADE